MTKLTGGGSPKTVYGIVHVAIAVRHVVRAAPLQRRPPAPQRRSPAHPRERRASSSHRRSPRRTRGDPDREPPPLRRCEGCGEWFVPSRPDRRTCSPACRMRACRRRAVLERYRHEVWLALRADVLTPDEALDLLVEPRQRVLELLKGAAA
jgi:hypothetical protein